MLHGVDGVAELGDAAQRARHLAGLVHLGREWYMLADSILYSSLPACAGANCADSQQGSNGGKLCSTYDTQLPSLCLVTE